jgi:Family of unknown function (DUF6090)
MIKFFRRIRQRLITENLPAGQAGKTSKYLLYAVGEIFLVVIGILIALQLNTLKEENKLADQETSYLKRLLSDNQQDLISFSEYINGFELSQKAVAALSAALNNPTNDTMLVQAAMDYYEYATSFPYFPMSKSTFEDLSSTGNLTVIKNSQLRDKIVQHYFHLEYMHERIRLSTEWALPLDAPFYLKTHAMKLDSSVIFLYPKENYKALAREIRQNKLDFIDNSAAHYWVNTDAMERFQESKQLTAILIEELENELETN